MANISDIILDESVSDEEFTETLRSILQQPEANQP